jgi:hypothetical protein
MYLMIRNAGVADPAAFTLLGVSTTRSAGYAGTIGMFGSGSKNAVAKFLRDGTPVTICPANQRMDFFSKPKFVSGQQFNQVCVKYSGKDMEGKSCTSTEDLGFTLEWGVKDWTRLEMAFREFVANAIDGATIAGGSYKDVEIAVVDKPRCKAGHTAVFLPLNEDVQRCWKSIGSMFLHLSRPDLLNKKLLPKISDKCTLIFKNGVCVSKVDEESVFDYNLGDELTLDESRNAHVWDVRYACSLAVAQADAGDIAKILLAQIEGKKVFESKLETSYLYNEYDSADKKKIKAEVFQAAFKTIGGNNAVLCSGKKQLSEFVQKKGFKPVSIEGNWFQVLQKYGVKSENEVLDGLEKEGYTESDATVDMEAAVNKVWDLLSMSDMLNGKEKPIVKAFNPIMSAEGQVFAMYKNGVVYIHTDLSTMSPLLLKAALEECVHHITGAGDMSRDLQDYLFRLVVQMWF